MQDTVLNLADKSPVNGRRSHTRCAKKAGFLEIGVIALEFAKSPCGGVLENAASICDT